MELGELGRHCSFGRFSGLGRRLNLVQFFLTDGHVSTLSDSESLKALSQVLASQNSFNLPGITNPEEF